MPCRGHGKAQTRAQCGVCLPDKGFDTAVYLQTSHPVGLAALAADCVTRLVISTTIFLRSFRISGQNRSSLGHGIKWS